MASTSCPCIIYLDMLLSPSFPLLWNLFLNREDTPDSGILHFIFICFGCFSPRESITSLCFSFCSLNKYWLLFFLKMILFIYLIMRERAQNENREGERIWSGLPTECRTPCGAQSHHPEPKRRVGSLTNWATQTPPNKYYLLKRYSLSSHIIS